MIGKKLCYLFNQSESLFPRSSFATHDPQFALSFACTLCAVNLGYTVCCTVFCTRFCYPQKTIFQSQGSGIWAQNSKAAPRLLSPLPTPSVQTLIPALLILLELVYIHTKGFSFAEGAMTQSFDRYLLFMIVEESFLSSDSFLFCFHK